MNRVSPLVTTGWLSKVLTSSTPGIRILDSSWFVPAEKRQPRHDYDEKHIPEALFFDIEQISDQTSPYIHTLPHPQQFGDHVGRLGITKDTHVIVYDNNTKLTAFSSPRAWWMFRVFGHQQVSVLEGGLPKWIKGGHPVTSEITEVEKKVYSVNFQPQLLKKFEDMVTNLSTHSFQVMDTRPRERIEGKTAEPIKGIKAGKIPYAQNIPFTTMFNSEERTFKTPEEMKAIFENAGIDLGKPLVSTCSIGITACIVSLGAYISGKEDVAIFNGSWEEYSQRASTEHIIATGSEGHKGG